MLPDVRHGPAPTVLLRHVLPDGSEHVDWMIAHTAESGAALISFRLPAPLHTMREGEELPAESIGDHRAAYLDYEGPVSGGRGHVERLARGMVINARESRPGGGMRLELDWESASEPIRSQYLAVLPVDSPKWRVILLARSQFARYQ